jgi:hypothetical protein
MRRRRRGKNESFEVDVLLLFSAEPAVRDGADAEGLGSARDGDGEGEL